MPNTITFNWFLYLTAESILTELVNISVISWTNLFIVTLLPFLILKAPLAWLSTTNIFTPTAARTGKSRVWLPSLYIISGLLLLTRLMNFGIIAV